jgi:hypothetical protein
VAAQSAVQRLDEVHPLQMAVYLDPILDTATGTMQPPAFSTLCYPHLTFLVQGPVSLEPQKDNPATIARVKPTESQKAPEKHRGQKAPGSGLRRKHLPQPINKINTILVILEYLSAFDPPHNNMMKGTGCIYTRFTRHGVMAPNTYIYI